MKQRYFSITDVARATNRHYSTVYQWVRHKQIPPPMEIPWTGGRRRYYTQEQFEAVVGEIKAGDK
jgi:DNA-binding transcriptional MerR regulator